MTQITRIIGNSKIGKVTKSIQQASKKVTTLVILLSKNKPKIMRNTIISPLIKKMS